MLIPGAEGFEHSLVDPLRREYKDATGAKEYK